MKHKRSKIVKTTPEKSIFVLAFTRIRSIIVCYSIPFKSYMYLFVPREMITKTITSSLWSA